MSDVITTFHHASRAVHCIQNIDEELSYRKKDYALILEHVATLLHKASNLEQCSTFLSYKLANYGPTRGF